jgi:hypothetical protein
MSDESAIPGTGRSAEPPAEPGRRAARLVREVRTHPFGYGVMAAFIVIGPLVALYLFPEAPPAVCIVGGIALGAYAAMCAVPQKFL